MTREQYESTKRRLEEQLRAGIELLEAACTAQIRALDLVWMLHSQEGGSSAAGRAAGFPALPPAIPLAAAVPEPPRAAARPRRKTTQEVWDDFGAIVWDLPAVFTRQDVCEKLGYEPDRGVLYRLLEAYKDQGVLQLQERGGGRRASVYERIEPAED